VIFKVQYLLFFSIKDEKLKILDILKGKILYKFQPTFPRIETIENNQRKKESISEALINS